MIQYRPAGTRVTRHLVALFVVCALLPLGAATYVVYNQVHEALVAQRIALLKDAAAGYATALVDRLNAADAVARAGALDTGYFRSGVVLIPGPPRALFGNVSRMPVRAEIAELDKRIVEGTGALALVRQSERSAAVWLLRTVGSQRLALELDPKYLWAVEDRPYLVDLCVLGSDGAQIACTRPLPESALEALTSRTAGSHGERAWEGADGRYLSGSTEVFLRGRFGAGTWTIVASQPERHALEPVHAIGRLVVPLLLLAVLGAALVGVVQVRRTLTPLQTLTEAAGRLGAGDFSARVPQERDNEFGDLGAAFNSMSGRLGRQFASLAAHAEIDAVILAGVDLPRLVAIVLRRMAEVAPADRHFLLLVERGTRSVFAVHSTADVAQLKLSEPEIRRLLAAPAGAPGVEGIEGRSVFALPIILGGDLAGAIVLASDRDRQPAPDEIAPLRDLADRVAVALATARRDHELQRRAHYDSLTQLPNRLLGMEELTRAVAFAERSGRSLAVLFVDLDGFSDVNDSTGHAAGDQLLVQAAARLRRCVRKSDVVARLGGDEFAVVLPEVRDAADAARAARNIIEEMSAPFQVGASVFVSACIGIALYPGDGAGAEELLRHADLAMYRAKAGGRGQIAFFEVSMNAEIRRRVELEQELRVAMEKEQFVLHYQPQMDLKSGRIVCAEALIRWMHPQRGLVPPAQFIHFAESNGMIMDIGRWALRAAVAQFVGWQAHGVELGHISVNVSPRQFRDPAFTGIVAEALRDFLMPPACLRIEITESALMDHEAVEANLAGISAFGVRLELDDFGTGYSSLAHLQRLPVAAVKLDAAFIRGIEGDTSAQAVVRAAIDMAHALGKSVVAEGVENAAQRALLEHMGCDTMQGYLLSPPVIADKFGELLDAHAPAARTGLLTAAT